MIKKKSPITLIDLCDEYFKSIDKEIIKNIGLDQAIFGRAIIKIRMEDDELKVENIRPRIIEKKQKPQKKELICKFIKRFLP